MRFPDIHHHEIAATYQRLRDDAYKMLRHLIQWRSDLGLSTSSGAIVEYAHYPAACCLIISLSLVLGCLLRAFVTTNLLLCKEAIGFCGDIVTIAELASCHRPVGSGYAAVCPVAAWAATYDPEQLARIETTRAEYQLDYIGFNWSDRANWLQFVFDALRQRVLRGDSQSSFDSGNETCGIL